MAKEGGAALLVPCVWRRGDDGKMFEVAVSENELRTGDSPLERARKMQRLADFGRDHKQIAIVFGCGVPAVKSALALLECGPAVQRAVESGKVSATVAAELSKLSKADQEKKLDEMVAVGATKGAAAVKTVRGKPSPTSRAVTPGKRLRLREVLTNGATEGMTKSVKAEAALVAATLAFVDGDNKAFKDWPEVETVVIGALVSPAKEKKEKKSRKKGKK